MQKKYTENIPKFLSNTEGNLLSIKHITNRGYEVCNFGVLDAAAIFRRDYRKIVSSYRELPSCPRVCLIAPIRIFRVWGIPLMGLYPETMEEGIRPAIHEIAADLGLQCIDLKEVFNDNSYCLDGVHPQRKGTQMIAEQIFKEL